MEVRAHYVMVGVFSLLVILGAVLFSMWISHHSKRIPMSQYDIFFTESVSGLSVNNEVLFSGVRVGTVTEIKISETVPGEVRVRVSIAADTPVRENSEATLSLRGVTGVSIISISGGTVDSPLNKPAPDTVGVIAHQPSSLSTVVASLPETISSANETLKSIQKVLSEENIENLSRTLASIERFTAGLAASSGDFEDLVRNARDASEGLAALSDKVTTFLDRDVSAVTGSFSKAAKRLDAAIADLEPGLKQFSEQGLEDIRLTVLKARDLIHSLGRLSRELESDPRRFLFGEPVQEYRSK